MKILLFAYALHKPGGTERVIVNLANCFVDRAYETTVISTVYDKVSSFYPLNSNVKLVRYNLMGKFSGIYQRLTYFPKVLTSFRKYIKMENPDIVICFGEKMNVLVSLALTGTKIPLIVTEHFTPGYYKIGKFWDILREVSYRRAKYVTVLTADSANYFSQAIKNKIVVMPNIVPKSPVKKNYTDETKRVIAIGRLALVKGFDILIEAFKLVNVYHPDWILDIWGNGEQKDDLQKLIDQYELNSVVKLRGVTTNINLELANSDIFVLSSRLEPFGMVICEAMSVGLPVISTDCPSGPATIITNGEDGILVANDNTGLLSDAIISLINDKEKRATFGRCGLKSVEKFSEENIMVKWISLIENCEEYNL